jgi:hypothetical protein
MTVVRRDFAKSMKKILSSVFAIFAVVYIIPSIALAAWWNPFTWNFNNFFSFFNKPIKTETAKIIVPEKINNEISTTTNKEVVVISTSTSINSNGLKT